ncbi:MAG: TonB-dependent receptor plug domain-containing protein, partial [Myxococcota bacterium]|nr:TonB-dependent receptor plug domain-containing protein [Myxococcota bacterium]
MNSRWIRGALLTVLVYGTFFALAPNAGAENEVTSDQGLADLEEASPSEWSDQNDADESAEDRYRGMEEIRVTARGGTENLQDVGSSIAAFDADYIEALGAHSIADLSQFTPNLEIRTVFAASNPSLFIRGVGLRDFNANSSSAVAVYNDDIYMNSPASQLSQLFDVQQVEVLRGPQGTLYGRNASAGAIRIISRKPTGDTNGYTRVTYGNYNDIQTEAALELPLSSTLSVRFSGRMRKREGYTRNRCADPRYNKNDGEGNPASFHNIVYNFCFNDDVTRQDTYLGSPVQDNTLAPGESNPFTQRPVRPYYSYETDGSAPTIVPWYYDRELADGMPLPGAVVSPTSYRCYVSGCSYASPLPEGAEPLIIPAPYYSQEWKKGAVPPDIDLWANDVDNWASRMLLHWKPNETVSWILNVHGGMNRGDSVQFQHIGAWQGPAEYRPNLALYRDGDPPGRGYFDADLIRGNILIPGQTPARTPEGGDPYAGDYNRVGTESL